MEEEGRRMKTGTGIIRIKKEVGGQGKKKQNKINCRGDVYQLIPVDRKEHHIMF